MYNQLYIICFAGENPLINNPYILEIENVLENPTFVHCQKDWTVCKLTACLEM